jgi:hypothetical protein
MLGKEPEQKRLFAADEVYAKKLGEKSFYLKLAQARSGLFTDETFAGLYVLDNGRPSVPPSLLATALILQAKDQVSDEEAFERARFDVRWCAALGLEVAEQAFVKSTLQRFRSLLILHEEYRLIFLASVKAAEAAGLFGQRYGQVVALDTTPIFGKGAVKDSYNLLADGIRRIISALARQHGMSAKVYAQKHGYERYYGSSIKGESDVNWSDDASIKAFLTSLVNDALALLEAARTVRNAAKEGSKADRAITDSSELLSALLLQDIERQQDGTCTITRGVAKDRLLSLTDPEMRYGHKSKSTRFEGHKAAIAVETQSQIITAVDVLPGNAPDHTEALTLIAQSEQNTGHPVDKTIGDCAYGDGQTRKEFADAGRELVARVPKTAQTGRFSKTAFVIDLEKNTITCPQGHTVTECKTVTKKGTLFQFPDELCVSCPLRASCTTSAKHGRVITVHPQEALLQKARDYQKSDAFTEDIKARQSVEHRFARLKQLGVRNSRFFGRAKTKFQLMMASTVANLTRIFAQDHEPIPPPRPSKPHRTLRSSLRTLLAHRRHIALCPTSGCAPNPLG